MAFGDPYATPEDFATFIQKDLTAAETATVTMLLDAASRAVEDFTGRQFNKTTTASERHYRAVDPRRVPVDDFHTTTDLAVKVDGTAWDATDFESSPYDGVYKGRSGWPFFDLLAVNRIWPGPTRRATVAVTAQWGWAAVPEAIQQATLEVAKVTYISGSGSGVVQSLAVEDYRVSYASPQLGTGMKVPPELVTAAPYRRVKFGVA